MSVSVAPAPVPAPLWLRDGVADLVEREVAWPRAVARRMDPATSRRSAVLLLFGPRPAVEGPAVEGPGAGAPTAADPAAAAPGELTAGSPGPWRAPERAEDLDLLLVRRSTTVRHHAGQVALPGGGAEPGDHGPQSTALREAHEETGADPASIDVLGVLPPLGIPVSGNLVTPVIGWWHTPGPIAPMDPAEIDLVRRVPLPHLLDPARRVRAYHPPVKGIPRESWTPGVELDEALMWGFTGILVTSVIAELGWSDGLTWEAAGRTDAYEWSGRSR